jgi:hypothetical protein
LPLPLCLCRRPDPWNGTRRIGNDPSWENIGVTFRNLELFGNIRSIGKLAAFFFEIGPDGFKSRQKMNAEARLAGRKSIF